MPTEILKDKGVKTKLIKLEKSLYLVLGIILLLTFTCPATGAIVKESQPSMEYQIPSSWREIDLNKEKLDTDINSDIILRAFEPSKGSLLLVTGYFLEDQFSISEWLSAMRTAFSGDKNIKIVKGEIERIGKNNFVSLAISGKGTGYKFNEKGKVNTIRHTFLVPNGQEIIQFILICPEAQYSKLQSAVRNVLGTLTLKKVISKTTSPPPPVKEKETAQIKVETSTKPKEVTSTVKPTEEKVLAPTNEKTPVETPKVTPNIPMEEQTTLSDLELLRIKLFLLENDIWVFTPEVRNNLCDMVIMTSSSKKAYRAKILVAKVEESPSGYNLIWSIPKDILNTTDLLILLKENKQVGWIVPLEDMLSLADRDKEKNVFLISSLKKIFGEQLTFLEYLDKRFSNYKDVLK
jgi:hypothetical protein